MTTPPNGAVPSSEPAPRTVSDPPQTAPYGAPAPPPQGVPPQGVPPQGAYAAPQYAAPVHVGAPYGAAPHQAAAPPARNVLGIVSLGIGVLLLLSGTASMFVRLGMMTSGEYMAIGAVFGVFSIFQGVLAVAAIACGGIGLSLKGRSKAVAGIGLGIGIAVLWSILGEVVYGGVFQFVL